MIITNICNSLHNGNDDHGDDVRDAHDVRNISNLRAPHLAILQSWAYFWS